MLKRIFIRLIRFYQRFVSPGLPASCRFYPTCSEYMVQAVEKRGLWRGLALGLRRVLRCNPFHPGGFDPIP